MTRARSTLAGGIERQSNIIWQKKWTWSVGGELIATDERDVDIATGTTRRRTFFIGALPGYLGYDGSNDLLDPTAGFRLSARFSPEASLQSGSFGYARAQLDGSVYQPVTDSVAIAGRTRLGTILGASRDRIAPSRRFYAGGGGSVRGYGYPGDSARATRCSTIRSAAAAWPSSRSRRGSAASAISASCPSSTPATSRPRRCPTSRPRSSAPASASRYHTRFGPIRVDVGTPLNPRSGDPRIAVYVSLGQAF